MANTYLVRTTDDRQTACGFDSAIVTADDEAGALSAAAALLPAALAGEGPAASGTSWEAIEVINGTGLDGDDVLIDGRVLLSGEPVRGA